MSSETTSTRISTPESNDPVIASLEGLIRALPEEGGDWQAAICELGEATGFRALGEPFAIEHAVPSAALDVAHDPSGRRFLLVEPVDDAAHLQEVARYQHLKEHNGLVDSIAIVHPDLKVTPEGEGFVVYELPQLSYSEIHVVRNTADPQRAKLNDAILHYRHATTGNTVPFGAYLIGADQDQISFLPPFADAHMIGPHLSPE